MPPTLPRMAALPTRSRVPSWLAGGIATLLVTGVLQTDAWRGFEERALGLVLVLRGPLPWNPDVHIIGLDDETFSTFGRPVPRIHAARLVEALTAAGAGVIAFDLVYDAPAADGPLSDQRFGDAITRHGRVVLPVDCLDERLPSVRAQAELAAHAFSPGPTPAATCHAVVLSRRELTAGAHPAHFLLATAPSGFGRSAYLFADYDGLRLPGLALAAWAQARGLRPSELVQEPDGVRAGSLFIPVSARGELFASYRELASDVLLSYGRLLSALGDSEPPRFPPALAEAIRGKHFLFAVTAKSSGDKGADLVGRRLPHTVIHAALLSDLLEGRPIRQVGPLAHLFATLLAGAVLTGAAIRLRMGLGVLAMFTAVISSFAFASMTSGKGLFFLPLGPATAALFAWAATTAARLGSEERERRVLHEAFGAYVDPAVLSRVLGDPSRYLALGGAKRELTVLFADMSGFTALSNALTPDRVIALMREFLAAMIDAITTEQGRVDKIMGDGILAVFGDPLPSDDHAVRAVRAALTMQARMVELRQAWTKEGLPRVGLRVGVATGEVFVGNVGAPARKLEYTVLGAPVNLASRLEGRAPVFGVLVSEETQRQCGGQFTFVRLSGFRLKGFAAEQVAYLVAGTTAEPATRKHPRLSVETPVKVTVPAGSAEGTVENVSMGGLFVRCALPVKAGESVRLEFWKGGAGVTVTGTVRHARGEESPAGFGVALAGETLEDASHVLAVLYGGTEAARDVPTPEESLHAEPVPTRR